MNHSTVCWGRDGSSYEFGQLATSTHVQKCETYVNNFNQISKQFQNNMTQSHCEDQCGQPSNK